MSSPAPGFSLRAAAALIRPKQWLKNLFVFAPLIFARELFDAGPFVLATRAFLGFCMVASSIYVLNDIADAEADRAHPEKRHRPLAAGTITVRHALAVLLVLLAGGAATVAGMEAKFLVLLILYFAMNVAYSFWLKRVVLLDVFIIAAGFMFRVLGGAYAIDVRVSSWLVLCSLFISLFLGFAKRRGELMLSYSGGATSERRVLSDYRVSLIDQLLTITAAGTVISYALYTVAPRTVETFGTDRLIYTTVFVIFGVFRYLHLMHADPTIESPTNAVTRDLPIIATVALWIASCVVLIYGMAKIPWLGP